MIGHKHKKILLLILTCIFRICKVNKINIIIILKQIISLIYQILMYKMNPKNNHLSHIQIGINHKESQLFNLLTKLRL